MNPVAELVADLQSTTAKLTVADLAGLADDEIATLLCDLHRVEAMLRATVVSVVGEVETRGLHHEAGHRNVATHLAHLLTLRRETAAATAQLAHKRWLLPHTIQALGAGAISEAHAQIIGRAWTLKVAADFARDEPFMVEQAQRLTFKEFYFFIEHWKNIADPDRAKANADRAIKQRRLYCSHLGDRVHTNAVSDAISGATLKAAIDRVAQELFTQDWAWTKDHYGDEAAPSLMPRTPAQRRHDALIELVERGSAAAPDAKLPRTARQHHLRLGHLPTSPHPTRRRRNIQRNSSRTRLRPRRDLRTPRRHPHHPPTSRPTSPPGPRRPHRLRRRRHHPQRRPRPPPLHRPPQSPPRHQRPPLHLARM